MGPESEPDRRGGVAGTAAVIPSACEVIICRQSRDMHEVQTSNKTEVFPQAMMAVRLKQANIVTTFNSTTTKP